MTAIAHSNTATLVATTRGPMDLGPVLHAVVGVVATGFSVFCTLAVSRAIGGWAPAHPATQSLAVMLHIATVIPAVPLGGWLMLARKGTPRHKLLGKVWVGLMFITAIAALFVRQLNPGQLSPIHLFVPLTLYGCWQIITTARRGDIAAHRKALLRMYLGAMMIPGVFAFLPGRLMGTWLFG